MIVAAVVALVGLSGTVASLVYLHVAPTGLSPIQNPVSQYGITPFRGGYRAATLSFAVAGAALFWAVARVGVPGGAERLELVALGVFALARAAISWFPMDAPGTPHTATGRWHGLLATAAFVGIAVAAHSLRSRVAPTVFTGFASTSHFLGTSLGICLLAMLVVRRGAGQRGIFGAVERVFYLLALTWCTLLAITLL